MDKKIRVGIIGVGRGQSFARGATDTVGMELVAVCDVWQERLAEMGQQYGVTTYTDYAKFLEHDMDAVILRAPHERLERGRPWIKLVTKEAVAAAGRPVWVELESTLQGRGGYDAIEDLEAVIADAVESGAGGLVFSDWRAFEDGRDPDAPRKRKVVHGLFR